MSDAIDNTDPGSDLPCPIIAIGASAGGLEALQAMMATAPEGAGAAYIIVQHLDPDHESLMPELLARRTDMHVQQAEEGIEPEADCVYLIPPGRSMTMTDGILHLEDFPLPRGVRRPIDTFFLSLADDIERGFACVVLSGTGTDGSRAFRAVKEAGGITVVQDPHTAKFDGMPRAAIDTGFADFVLPPEELAPRINEYFERLPGGDGLERDVSEILPDICARLREQVGHDFSGYKPATLIRRTKRRIQLTGAPSPEAYLTLLRANPAECEALFREFLINVTEFFRDDDLWRRLRTEIIPRLADAATADHPVRIWIPGCSSGEEAYSYAMLLDDALAERKKRVPVSIFASDIDEQMLRFAREARYPVDAIDKIPEPFRTRYLIAQEGGFTVSPQVRDMVRFAQHSLIKDPPFTRLDLISCRNLLIYLGADLQEDVLPTFHYALRERGTLVLGSSEGLGRHGGLFEPIDAKQRVYLRASAPARQPRTRQSFDDPPTAKQRGTMVPSMPQATMNPAARRVLDRYAPAHLVVDRTGMIQHTSGRLTKYFEIPPGAPTQDVVALSRPGLRAPLRRVLKRTEAGEERAAIPDVEVASELGVQTVDIVCERMDGGARLVVIRDVDELRARDEDDFEREGGATAAEDATEDELRQVKFRLRTTVEELEAANEELKSSNEEMMSMNEELQSANEELSTVNDELKIKMDEVAGVNADLANFLQSSDIATVILNSDLEVRVFTPRARDVFPLREGDIGRALSDVTAKVDDAAMMDDARAVLRSGEPVEREVRTRESGQTFLMRITPYEAPNGEAPDGVILTFTDVTALKKTERKLRIQKERLALAVKAAHIGVWEWRMNTGAVFLNEQSRELFGVDPGERNLTFGGVTGRIDTEALPRVQAALDHAIETDGLYEATFPVHQEDGTTRMLFGIGQVIKDARGKPDRFIGINRDITEERAAEDRQKILIRELNHRVKNIVTVIGSMIQTSGRRAESLEDFVQLCHTRIASISAAHTLLVESDFEGAPVCEVVSSALDIFGVTDRVDVTCVGDVLPAMEAQAISLVLHELTTNAMKHGALSVPEGRVTLDVEAAADGAAGEPRLRLSWVETGGPEVAEPARKGFGTMLLRDMIKHQHRGETVFDWREEGLAYRLEFDARRSARMGTEEMAAE